MTRETRMKDYNIVLRFIAESPIQTLEALKNLITLQISHDSESAQLSRIRDDVMYARDVIRVKVKA